MSTIDPSQLTAADLSNPALSAQDLADITAARPDLRPYVATHPSLYPALGQWLADQGVVPAQPPAAEEPVAAESEAPAEESADQGEPFGGAHEDAQPEADAAPTEAADEQPAFEEPAFEEPSVEAPAEHEAAHVEPEAPVSEASEAHDDNLEQAILEGASQSEAPADGGASPALSTEEQVAQSPFSNPPHSDAQPQQGQQAPFGQPGQQQFGQPGYAPAGPSAGQQFSAAANTAFNQFQSAVVAETGKVSGRSVRATYSLIGIAASAVLILVSMLLPFVTGYGRSLSMFAAKTEYSSFHLILLMAVVGLGAAYWFTNQKWAYLSAGIGALVMALLGVIQFIVAVSNEYFDAGFGAYLLALFSIAIGVAGGFLLMELKNGAVAPIHNPNAFGGAFAGAPMGQQQGQFGQQQGGFQAPQAGQPQFGQQQGGFQAPQGGQPQFGQQQGGFQAPQGGQPQFGQQQGGFQAPQGGQGQFGQQPGQQLQLGDKPHNPFGSQS